LRSGKKYDFLLEALRKANIGEVEMEARSLKALTLSLTSSIREWRSNSLKPTRNQPAKLQEIVEGGNRYFFSVLPERDDIGSIFARP